MSSGRGPRAREGRGSWNWMKYLLISGGSKSSLEADRSDRAEACELCSRQAGRQGQLNSFRSLYAHSERRQREAAGSAPI